MPTKKRRVGFIPREDVMRIIDKLSIENNLSNSKIISILVEEALSKRGIFNKKNGKLSNQFMGNYDHAISLSDNSAEFTDNAKFINDNKSGKNYSPSKLTNLNEETHGNFDLQTYKKFLSFLKFQEMMDKYHT